MTRETSLEGEDSAAIDNMFKTTGYECDKFTFGSNGVGVRAKEEGSDFLNYYTFTVEDGVGTLTVEYEHWIGNERLSVQTIVQKYAGHLGKEGDKYFMMFDNAENKASYTEEYPYLLAGNQLIIKEYDEHFTKVFE